MVQDWRGMVMSQEDHTRAWGFGGYPATHGTDCTCRHCETTTTNYRINTGYSMVRHNGRLYYTPTRRQVYDYINDLNERPWIKKEETSHPRKK